MTTSAIAKANMNFNTSRCSSSRVKDLGKKAEEVTAQQRLEEEMAKAEAELKREGEKKKAENVASHQRLDEETAKTEADQKRRRKTKRE